MKHTKIFEVEYNYFEPGTWVIPTSPRCPLKTSQMYRVTRCLAPSFFGDEAIMFVEGHKTGVSTEYVRAAASKEIHPHV